MLNNGVVNSPALSRFASRVTGRWAISWQVIVFANLLTYPQMVLTGGTLGSRQVPPEDLPTSAAIMGVTVGLNAAYGTLAMFTVFRNRARRPVPLWLYVGFYLTAGVIPVLGMEYLDAVLGEQTALPVVLRLFFACTTTLWLGIVFSLLLEGRDRFRTERADLLQEAVDLRAAAIRESDMAAEIRSTMDQLVEENLVRARERIDRVLVVEPGEASSQQWTSVADEFERAASSTVRPLSHELWRMANQEYPKPKASRVFAELWRRPWFLPWSTVLITAIGLPGASVRGFGAWAPIALGLLLALQFAVMRLANSIIKFTSSTQAKRLVYVITVVILVAMLLTYSLIPGEVTAPVQDAGAIVIAFVVAVVLISFVGQLNDSRRYIIASLEDDIVQEQVENEAKRAEIELALRDLGQVLHGPVQARLLACAAGIEQASALNDSDALAEALREGISALEYTKAHPESRVQSLASALDAALEGWRAFCDINLHLSAGLGDRTDLSVVVRVVEEAVVNAYRHGHATVIDIDVSDAGESIGVTVRDDGDGPVEKPAGLGMRIFEESTSGAFSLQREGEWTMLQAQIVAKKVGSAIQDR